MITIGKLAKKVGLARSTLLYYDSIGLLCPSERAESGYRLYSADDAKRLEQICLYRQMGLSLEDIAMLLDQSGRVGAILEDHLEALNKRVQILRKQQFAIVALLKQESLLEKSGLMNKKAWVGIMASAGLDEAAQKQWHIEFEKRSPKAHQAFLVGLGIGAEEIKVIRGWNAENDP